MHTYDDLAVAVAEERRRQGVTVKALAARSGIPRVTLDRYLHGVPIPYDRMRVLCELLGIEVQATVTKSQQQSQATEAAA